MSAVLRKLLQGQSLLRISMNRAFRAYALTGEVVDVGGGHSPDYLEYFDTTAMTSFTPVDGSMSGINFEEDPLPYDTASVETVLCANVLEHMYNYAFLVGEMHRILQKGGSLIGFVPFLIQYHPDPHDYFRYTKEALERIFTEAGFTTIHIKEIGGGPFLANFNNLVLSLPRVVRPVLYFIYACLDWLFLKVSASARMRYPLGFVFSMTKPYP